MLLDQHELKRRLILRLKGVESGKVFIGPATVQFHLTDQCNLACKYCYFHSPGSRNRPAEKKHLPFNLFTKVIRNLVELKVDRIYLSGQGEPTLHPHFWEMLDYLKQQPLSTTIYSNGTFSAEYCRNILFADRIVINLGEADRASYREVHGKDFFIRVIRNISELARIRSRFNPAFRIEIVFPVNKLNVESQSRMEKLIKEIGADMIHKKATEIYEHTNNLRLENREDNPFPGREWPSCYQGWFYSAIRLNGDVNVCCMMQRLTLGNIHDSSFKNIWESQQYQQARLSALTGDPFQNYPECVNCCLSESNRTIEQQMKKFAGVKRERDEYSI